MSDKRAGAMKVRSHLARHRPWLSDGVWIAHESLPFFGRIAAVMPGPGWWELGQGGASLMAGRDAPDLTAKVAEVVDRSRPCVLNHGVYERYETIDEAMVHAGEQRAEVLDQDGALWSFDLDFIEVALVGQKGWTWRLAPNQTGAALIGLDRKDRPRFVVMNMGDPS